MIRTLLIVSLFLNFLFLYQFYQRTVVISVPDGDSLQLFDGRRVRLLGIDAPEKDRCMADEARITLQSAAKGKHVTLKDTITDDYGRQLAHVFTFTTNLNEYMVSRGLARSSHGFTAIQNTAKMQKLGIWSETCRKTSNPDCTIKGNNRSGKKTYLLPDCSNYDQTIIDESYGDQWFCTEKEAIAGGFTKASGCIKT